MSRKSRRKTVFLAVGEASKLYFHLLQVEQREFLTAVEPDEKGPLISASEALDGKWTPSLTSCLNSDFSWLSIIMGLSAQN